MSAATAAAAPAAPAARQNASLADWLAVIAGTVGATMALMDVSIVNSSLPVIQGEIGATPSEATWVGTAYLVAEIVVIPLTAWLERLLGLRRLLLGGAALFTAFSVFCGFATNLEMMIIGRVGQGLSGGVLIPTALNLIATRLPPHQQLIALAMTAVSALLGPTIGPLLGGWLTENYGWQYAFFINVPICAVQAAMLIFGVSKTRGNLRELRKADWFGIAGMVIGLGAMTTLLEEGHREQWFDSVLIWQLAIATVTGFALIAIGQMRPGRPIIRLSLLRNRGLASAVGLLGVLGMLLFTSMFITPQFLVTVAGYNAQDAGFIAFICGIVSIPAALVYPLLATRLDARLSIGFAILLAAAANYLLTGLSVQSAGSDFILTQFLFGIGVTWTAMPLQQAVIASVPPEDASEANGLSSIARNLGGSIGLAALASFQDLRLDFHHWQVHSSLSANDIEWQQQIAGAASQFGGGPDGVEAAMRMLDGQVLLQALVMSFNDIYLAFTVLGLVSLPLVVLLRPPPSGASAMAVH